MPHILGLRSRRLVVVYLLLMVTAAGLGLLHVLQWRGSTLTDATNAIFMPWRLWMTPGIP